MNPTDPGMPPLPGAGQPASIPTPQEPITGTGDTSGSTANVAKEQAGDVKDTAKQAGGQVVGEAKQQAANVAGEVVDQTQNLLHQGLAEIRNRTGDQQQRLAETVHSWAKELGAMASSSEESGPMTNLVQDASRRTGALAHWLQEHEPRDILHELRSFARRRPGTFLLAAAAAGVFAGRLTRGFSAERSSGSSGSSGLSDASGSSVAGELPPAEATPGLSTGIGGGAGLGQPYTDPLTGGDQLPGTGTSGIGTSGIGSPGVGSPGIGSPGFESPGAGTPGTGSSGLGAADAGTGPLDSPPAGPGTGTGTGSGLGPDIAGPGSAGPGFGPGGVGPGLSEPGTAGEPPAGGVDPTPSVPPNTPER